MAVRGIVLIYVKSKTPQTELKRAEKLALE